MLCSLPARLACSGALAGARERSEWVASMDRSPEKASVTDQREMEAAVGVAALKARICEAIVLVLTALVRQVQRLLAGEAEPTMGAQYGQLARLALEDLEGLYAQALRLVYRLLVTETLERAGLLGVEDPFGEREQLTAGAEAPAYRLWRGLQQRWVLLRAGCRRRGLTLAPYPGRLFDPATTPYLEALPLPDAPLAQILALFKSVPLAAQVSAETGWIWPPAALYEDLLAYEPRLASEPLCEVQDRGRRFVLPARLTVPSAGCDGRRFSPVARPIRTISPGDLYLAPGSGRKSSGSYSTPPALVSYLVRRTLEPLVKGCRGVEEVLALRVVDPAMGTGAFLVAACDYLARACVCSSGAAEAPQEATCEESLLYRRLVAERCLSGVDFDELAVELARLSLWLFIGQPEQPAPFLCHNLRSGNSLLGMPLPQERAAGEAVSQPQHLARLLRLIPLPTATLPETTAERAQARRLADLWVALWFWPRSSATSEDEGAAPLPDERTCAALVAALAQAGDGLPSTGATEGVDERRQLAPYLRTLERLIRRLRPFHWPLEFPAAFFAEDGRLRARPGFDAVLGNPPWEILKPNSREFFAAYDPLYRRLERAEAERLRHSLLADRQVERSWQRQTRWLAALSRYVRASGLYPAQRAALGGGKASGGDLNSYKLFVDRSYRLLRPGGHAGLVVPASLYTDQSSTGLRRLLLEEGRLLVLLGFENRAALFPIDSRCKFALLVFARERPQPTAQVRAAFMLRDPAVLESDEERFTIRLPYALIARFAPETLSLLELRTQGEADLLSRIYGARPLLGEQQAEEEADAWSVMLAREFDLTSDRSLFNRAGQGWPLYEGKTIHQYCASFAAPRYYVLPAVGLPALLRSELARLERTLDALARERWPQLLPDSGRHERVAALLAAHGRGPLSARDVRLDCEVPRLAFRRVASGTNERSLIATILPSGCFLGNTLTYVRPWCLDRDRLAALLSAGPAQPLSLAYEPALSPLRLACLCGLLNSFVLDYVIRRKITVDLTMFQVRQLPVPHLAEDQPHCRAIARRVARLVCLDPAFQALRGQLLGSEDAPVLSLARRQERQQLQNEIDAIVAHLYGLSASDLRDLLFAPQSFPLVAPAIKEGVLRAFSAVERWLERE